MKESRARPIVVTIVCALASVWLVHVLHRIGQLPNHGGHITLDSRHAHFVLHGDGRIQIISADGARSIEAELVADAGDGLRVVDLSAMRRRGATAISGPITLHGTTPDAKLTIHIEPADVMDIEVLAASSSDAGPEGEERGLSVGLRFPLGGRSVFLSGRGELADLASETGRMAVVGDVLHPVGLVADGRDMHVELLPSSGDPRHVAMAATVPADARLSIVLASAGGHIWKQLFERAKLQTKHVRGIVTGATGTVQVVGLDEDGIPQLRATADVAGRFDIDAPPSVSNWYASASATRTSAPVYFVPGTNTELKLDVSDGGELHVRVEDGDTHGPLTARLVVHGLDGTLDPSFGPDYRASGAGPIIDALRGEITTPLPAGKYRVLATKGIEWSIDSQVVQIVPGKRAEMGLSPRHVVPTPGVMGADLHVHARPSFDCPVSADDRVLSLVAAGIDFAVPSEHNLVGDYGPSIGVLGLTPELAWVPGVEITTYTPRFGHFGLFPYPRERAVPPFKNSNADRVFTGARAGDAKRVLVVNHPRLTRDIGYFNATGYKAGGPIPGGMRTDFDAIEVYNGYESASIARVENVLADYYALLNAGHRYAATGSSDSHRIQYQWAGYPRTLVRIGQTEDDERHVDPLVVVAAIKAGHATVTSGPVIDLEIEGVRPGEDLVATRSTLLGKLVIRAAPWVDVTSAQVVLGGKVVQNFDVPSRPTLTGPETGTFQEAQARTVRLDAEVRLDVGADPTWVMVLARGSRTLDDVLPFTPIPPFAFTNPIFIRR